VQVTSFGTRGPWKDYLAPDLVAGALGGVCATTGDVDTVPLKPFGELNFMVSGAYAAIAALSALRHARETGQGQVVEAIVHEALASCLEQVFMFYWYHERLPGAESKVLPRRGSLHWSDCYQVVRAKDGWIMVTPTPRFDMQLAWLAQEECHEDLLDEKYQGAENIVALIHRTMDIMTRWAATKEVEPFFFEAQERHCPYGWVLSIDRVAANPQLEARRWWTDYVLGDRTVRGPGAPYQFADTPWEIRRPQAPAGADSEAVLAEIGWDDK
jgi:crotonobetainyl-CoA:carnitine CoA-transferase CaiB-like acyl-CoA transferase